MLLENTRFASLSLALACLAFCVSLPTARAEEPSSAWLDERLAVMTSVEATFADRCQAEDDLREKPTVAAISKLLPMLDSFCSDRRCGTGRTHDSDLRLRARSTGWAPKMQIDHAVNRLWYWTIEKSDVTELNREVVKLLGEEPPVKEDAFSYKTRLLMAIDGRWSEESEGAVRAIFDDKSDYAWWTALRVLAINGRTSMRDEILATLTEHDTPSAYGDLLNLVGSERYKERWGVDEALLDKGFDKLATLPLGDRSEVLHALNLVVALQGLANETFVPPFSSTGDEPEEQVEARRQKHERASIERAKRWRARNTRS